MYFLKRQSLIGLGSIVAMMWVSRLDYHMFSKYAAMSYWGSMLLLALVKFTPLGIEVNGARRWFRLPANQSFQPAEIMKIAVIIFIPYLICRMGNKVHGKICVNDFFPDGTGTICDRIRWLFRERTGKWCAKDGNTGSAERHDPVSNL